MGRRSHMKASACALWRIGARTALALSSCQEWQLNSRLTVYRRNRVLDGSGFLRRFCRVPRQWPFSLSLPYASSIDADAATCSRMRLPP